MRCHSAFGTDRIFAEGDQVTPVFAKRLPNVPAKNLTAMVVFYPPGSKSVTHNQAGSVLA
jgi:hypothetical protein